MSDQLPADGQLVTPEVPASAPAPQKARWWVWLVSVVVLVIIFVGASWYYLGQVNTVEEQTESPAAKPSKETSPEPVTNIETLAASSNALTTELTGLDQELKELDEDLATTDDETNF